MDGSEMERTQTGAGGEPHSHTGAAKVVGTWERGAGEKGPSSRGKHRRQEAMGSVFGGEVWGRGRGAVLGANRGAPCCVCLTASLVSNTTVMCWRLGLEADRWKSQRDAVGN